MMKSSKPCAVPSSCPTVGKGNMGMMGMGGTANSKAATKMSKVANKSMSPRGRVSGSWSKDPNKAAKVRDFSN